MTGIIKGVRVDGHNVILSTQGNDEARDLCGTLVELLFVHGGAVAPPAGRPTCRAGNENPCLPCFLDHGECVAPIALPPFDGVEEAQMAARAADQRRGAAL